MAIDPTSQSNPCPRQGLLSHLKAWEQKQMSDTRDSYVREDAATTAQTVKGAAIGAGVGLAAGTGLGAAAGVIQGVIKVDGVPVQHVTVEATADQGHAQPTFTNKIIGHIPGESLNTYQGVGDGTQPVTAPEPRLNAQGQPVMHDATLHFSGQGTPGPVQWVSTPVQVVSLDPHHPYGYIATPQYITETYVSGYDANGNPEYSTHTVPTGLYNNDFVPHEEGKTVGTYMKPEVNFNSGVDTGAIVLTDMAIGGVAGAVLGAISGALIAHNRAAND
ncbi:MAG: hypothetical protein ACYCW6_15970 [Candidatus Xenobia bacterium]